MLNAVICDMDWVLVDWASHGFIEEWTEQRLFEETLKFII